MLVERLIHGSARWHWLCSLRIVNPVCIRRDVGRLWIATVLGRGMFRQRESLAPWLDKRPRWFPPGPAPGLGSEQTCLRCWEENGLPHYQRLLPHLKYNAPGRRGTLGCCSHTVFPGNTHGTGFPKGTTLRPSPDPAVSETWVVLGLVGRDPGAESMYAGTGTGAWGDAGWGPAVGMCAGSYVLGCLLCLGGGGGGREFGG